MCLHHGIDPWFTLTLIQSLRLIITLARSYTHIHASDMKLHQQYYLSCTFQNKCNFSNEGVYRCLINQRTIDADRYIFPAFVSMQEVVPGRPRSGPRALCSLKGQCRHLQLDHWSCWESKLNRRTSLDGFPPRSSCSLCVTANTVCQISFIPSSFPR